MSNHISQVRESLLATLADLRNRDNPMDPERGQTIAKVAAVLVDSARVEVEYIKAIGGESSEFFKDQDRTIDAKEPIKTLPADDRPRTVLANGMYAQLGARQ